MIALITGKNHNWKEVADKFNKEVVFANDYVGQSDCVVICFEVGQGVTPVIEEQRKEIEINGRLNQKILAQATEVYRVWFGLTERIK